VSLGNGRFRLIGTRALASDGADESEQTILDEFERLVRRLAPPGTVLSDPLWLGGFRIHRRMVDRMREGRVLVAGDAAHIHSPVGGLGLNTGVQDAHNLGWKLALVAQGAPDTLLDTYNSERHPVAATTLRFTDLATRGLIVARSRVLRTARRHVIPRLLALGPVQRRLRDALSQLGISYGPSAVVVEDPPRRGRFGALRGRAARPLARPERPAAGERAPDAPIVDALADPPGRHLFEVFRDPRHLLLVFEGRGDGEGRRRDLAEFAESTEAAYGLQVLVRSVRLGDTSSNAGDGALIDATGDAHGRYGADEPCFVLVRPDGFVALRGEAPDRERLTAYLRRTTAGVGAPA
jgi:hypothetical protein